MGIFTRNKPATVEVPVTDIDSLLSGLVDRRHDALYDRVQLKAGGLFPSVLTMFQVPVGFPDAFNRSRIKQLSDTNMRRQGELSPPYDLVIDRMLILFQPSASQVDRDAVLSRFHWEYRCLQKSLVCQPTLRGSAEGEPTTLIEGFGEGSWLDRVGPRKGDDQVSRISSIGKCVCWCLDERKYLPPCCGFSVIFQGDSFVLNSDLDFYFFIDGVGSWPVQ